LSEAEPNSDPWFSASTCSNSGDKSVVEPVQQPCDDLWLTVVRS
jgi:hypothetical protein